MQAHNNVLVQNWASLRNLIIASFQAVDIRTSHLTNGQAIGQGSASGNDVKVRLSGDAPFAFANHH